MAVKIDDGTLGRILTPLGYPVVTLDTMTKNWDFVTREQFEDQLLYPALNEYFSFFPNPLKRDYLVTGTFTIPFPENLSEFDEVWGITDARLVHETVDLTNFGNPFLNGITMFHGQSHTPLMDPNVFGHFMQARSAYQGIRETFESLHCDFNWVDRCVNGYTNMKGHLAVTWAVGSRDFSKIRFDYLPDVIKLAQSYVLEFFGSLEKRSFSGMPVDLTGDHMLQLAEKNRADVLDKWAAMPKPVMMR